MSSSTFRSFNSSAKFQFVNFNFWIGFLYINTALHVNLKPKFTVRTHNLKTMYDELVVIHGINMSVLDGTNRLF